MKKPTGERSLSQWFPKQSHFSSSFMTGVEQPEVDDASAPPRKRQQQPAGEPYMSPESSLTNSSAHMPANDSQNSNTRPPPVLPVVDEEDCSLIKTPRSDISLLSFLLSCQKILVR